MSVRPKERDKPYEIVEETDEMETDTTDAMEMDTTDAMETDTTKVTETDFRTTFPVISNDSRAPPPSARR